MVSILQHLNFLAIFFLKKIPQTPNLIPFTSSKNRPNPGNNQTATKTKPVLRMLRMHLYAKLQAIHLFGSYKNTRKSVEGWLDFGCGWGIVFKFHISNSFGFFFSYAQSHTHNDSTRRHLSVSLWLQCSDTWLCHSRKRATITTPITPICRGHFVPLGG